MYLEKVYGIRVIDQAALHGLLNKVRDLGMPLLSINRDQVNTPIAKLLIRGKIMKWFRRIFVAFDPTLQHHGLRYVDSATNELAKLWK
jgi:hypothetical protein